MKSRSLLFIIVALTFISKGVYAQDKKFYIFLAFGQSNMEGSAKFEPVDTASVDPRFKLLQAVDCPEINRENEKWYTAVPPLCRCNSGLSPVDYFGRYLLENLPEDIQIGVINVAVGGCKIELFDKNNYQSYVETAPDWMLGAIKQYEGNPYQRLVDLGKIAKKDGVIKGILLHQGESNTGDVMWPKKVQGVYRNLLDDLNLKAEAVPLLAGEVVHQDQGGVCASMNNIIATLPQVIPTAHVISSKGCTDAVDNLHFDAAGYRELGERYGKQMLTLLNTNDDKD